MKPQTLRDYLKCIKPLRSAVRTIRQPVARRRQDVWVLEGEERHSMQSLSVLFAGRSDSRNYIANLLFNDAWIEKAHTRMWKGGLAQRSRRLNGGHDLAIVQSDKPQPSTDPAAGVFQVPCWVGGEKDLRAAVELTRSSEHIKSDIRRIRKNRLEYRVTSEPDEFDRFYYGMYLPHIRRVFGDHAFLMSYEAMQEALPQCELFLITRDGEDIAGGILVYDGSDRVRGWSLGVKDGDDRWVRAGALAAFEHLQTGYLLDKGFARLHRGASRPFLNDGALRFKKHRGMKVTDRNASSFIIIPRHDRPGVRAFLQHNPFVYADHHGRLKGAVFLSREAPPGTVERLFRDWYVPGLDCLTLFHLDEGQGQALSVRLCGSIDSAGTLSPAQ